MRLLAGLKVTRAELTGMGVGGLLMEIVTRPQPRNVPDTEGNRNVAAIMLAAGRSTRMGGPNKLLAELGGRKLVRIVTEQALASKASGVIVVTGHQAELVEKALHGLKVKFVRNPDFAGGLASSVKAGIAAVPDNADGAVVCLGDMPLISAQSDRSADRGVRAGSRPSDRGARQRRPARQSRAVVAPLLQRIDDARWRRRRASSDRQAREAVAEVPVDGDGAFLDIDTPAGAGSGERIVRQSSCRPGLEPGRRTGVSIAFTDPRLNLPFTKWKRPPVDSPRVSGDGTLIVSTAVAQRRALFVLALTLIAGRIAIHHGELGGRRLCGRQMRRLWPGVRLSRRGRGTRAA